MKSRTTVIETEGKFTLARALRKRVASFSSGVAVGSEGFVKKVEPKETNGKADS